MDGGGRVGSRGARGVSLGRKGVGEKAADGAGNEIWGSIQSISKRKGYSGIHSVGNGEPLWVFEEGSG